MLMTLMCTQRAGGGAVTWRRLVVVRYQNACPHIHIRARVCTTVDITNAVRMFSGHMLMTARFIVAGRIEPSLKVNGQHAQEEEEEEEAHKWVPASGASGWRHFPYGWLGTRGRAPLLSAANNRRHKKLSRRGECPESLKSDITHKISDGKSKDCP